MSDQRLRALERRWRKSGSTDDEATFLRERARSGDLSTEHLQAAAYLGHEAARSAIATSSETPPSIESDRGLKVLAKLPKEVQVRFAVAVARVALYGTQTDPPADAERALAVAEAWAKCPCKAHRKEAGEEGSRFAGLRLEGNYSHIESALRAASGAVASGARQAASSARNALYFHCLEAVGTDAPILDGDNLNTTIHEAVRGEMLPWLLDSAPSIEAKPWLEQLRAQLARSRGAPEGQKEIDGLLRALDSPRSHDGDQAWQRLRRLGEGAIPLLVAHYPRFKTWQGRVRVLFHLIPRARSHDEAFQLALGALSDGSKVVRSRACGLLAYSLRADALDPLNRLLGHPSAATRADAAAAIDAINHQNHHYFLDREHTGRSFWQVG